jgi:hypothetical protein
MTRREHERYENRRMIEKQQRIALITLNMKEQGATAEQLGEVSNILHTLLFIHTRFVFSDYLLTQYKSEHLALC